MDHRRTPHTRRQWVRACVLDATRPDGRASEVRTTVGWSAGMSEQTDTTTSDNAGGDIPPFRYSAALAADIESRWQTWWDEHRTFETPNPTGPLGDPELVEQRRDDRHDQTNIVVG